MSHQSDSNSPWEDGRSTVHYRQMNKLVANPDSTAATCMLDHLQVTLADSLQDRRDATSLLLADETVGREAGALIASLPSVDGLILARRHGEGVGAAWLIAPEGPAAMLIPPVENALAPRSTAAALIGFGLRLAWERGCERVQALIPVTSTRSVYDLQAAGFRPVAELYYLSAKVPWETTRPHSADPLSWQSYSVKLHDRMAAVIQRTYKGTLDCPGFDDAFDAHDALTSYQASGASEDRYWWLLQHEGDDVGCLLLADYPDHDQMELLYVGIVPEFRGRQWGEYATRWALAQVRAIGRSRLVLAVDRRNDPACNMYRRVGFVESDLRILLICKPT